MSGLIAIVGRPNVGKSALFNRIVGRRIAIVHDQPGVTRDRITAQADWRGRPFTLVDTGGIGLLRGERTEDPITQAAFTQVSLAIESADVIVFVVNLQDGLVPLDREVAARLRQSGKPVIVAANKADTVELEGQTADFNAMGFEWVLPVSAMHSRGIAPLVDAAVRFLPKAPTLAPTAPAAPLAEAIEASTPESATTDGVAEPEKPAVKHPAAPLKIAIVGRPNVGKSSLINALTQSERVIVSPIPGTTRDSVDVPFEVETDGTRETYVLIDTAGLRKRRRVDETIEFFSVKRAEESIERADLVILVLDAEMGVTEQDKKIGDRIVEAHKACIIVVNKWDLYAEAVDAARLKQVEKNLANPRKRPLAGPERGSLSEFAGWVQKNLFFLDYAPVIFTSAQTGYHLDRLLEAVRFVTAELQKQVPTALLNRTLAESIERKQPVSAMGHHLKFFYATQVRQAPPTFLLFVNRDELFSDNYTRYLTSTLRKAFGYEGCPIVLVAKARPQRIEPKRTPKPPRKGRPDPRSRESRAGGARSRNARARKDHRKRS
jgi:GTP-binding protein